VEVVGESFDIEMEPDFLGKTGVAGLLFSFFFWIYVSFLATMFLTFLHGDS